jgi:hypothetical protein
VDFSVFKDTHLTESKVLQLRAKTFNLASTPQFNNPAATPDTAAIGTNSSAASESTFQRTERQIQLAAKINFQPCLAALKASSAASYLDREAGVLRSRHRWILRCYA